MPFYKNERFVSIGAVLTHLVRVIRSNVFPAAISDRHDLRCIRRHYHSRTVGKGRPLIGCIRDHHFVRIAGKLRPRLGRVGRHVGRRVGCGTPINGVGCVSRRRLSPILVLT
ncbi:hypothetical protein TcG_09292 [Trypanosoma cruzi]|nr:hypothetical protein TcG_09292 [Trypanosoma cruzi]